MRPCLLAAVLLCACSRDTLPGGGGDGVAAAGAGGEGGEAESGAGGTGGALAGECSPGATVVCLGPGTAQGQRGIGACRDGVATCGPGGSWSDCDGAVGPAPEGTVCDGVDQDCDGVPDDGAANRCGTCGDVPAETCNGLDDDCDGLVDDGVVDVCGGCGEEPCYVEPFHEPANCRVEGRTCWFIQPDDNNPDAMTVGFGLSPVNGYQAPPPRLVLPLSDSGDVVALNDWNAFLYWQASTGASRVLRTSSRPDLGAYVVDGGEDPGGEGAGVIRLSRSGGVVCRAALPGALAVAVDAFGQGWVVTSEASLHAVDTFGVLPVEGGGVPRCALLDLAPDDDRRTGLRLPRSARHVAVDPSGLVLWLGSQPAVRVDLRTLAVVEVPHLDAGEVIVDEYGHAWFGGSKLHRVDGVGPYHEPASYELVLDVPGGPLAFPDWRGVRGVVAVLSGGEVIEVDATTLEVTRTPLPEALDSPSGIAASRTEIWVGAGDALARLADEGWTDPVVPVPGRGLRLDDDVSAMRLHMHGARWTQVVDSLYAGTLWLELDWQRAVPEGTLAEAYVRFASSRGALAAAPRCGPLDERASLAACPRARGSRFARVEVDMVAGYDGRKPYVGHLSIGWTRF